MRKSVKNRAIVALGVGILLWSSCNKPTIDFSDSNDPVFRIDGTIDGQPFSMVAGDDNAYMFTEVKTENGVNIFSGNLSNGTTGIEFGMYDGMVDIPNHQPLSYLPETFYFSANSMAPFATLSKDLMTNATLIDNVQWYINGNFVGMNDYDIMAPGKYEVCGTVNFLDGTTHQMCSELILGYAKNANCTIKHFLNQEGELKAWIDDLGYPIEKVQWFLDGQLVETQSEFSTVLAGVSYNLDASVSFDNGVIRSKSSVIDGSLSGKYINDFTQFEMNIATPFKRDFAVYLKFMQDGIQFSSENIDNSDASAEILDITYYGKNLDNEEVYKITANITVKVSDASGANIKELAFTSAFGIAIPN